MPKRCRAWYLLECVCESTISLLYQMKSILSSKWSVSMSWVWWIDRFFFSTSIFVWPLQSTSNKNQAHLYKERNVCQIQRSTRTHLSNIKSGTIHSEGCLTFLVVRFDLFYRSTSFWIYLILGHEYLFNIIFYSHKWFILQMWLLSFEQVKGLEIFSTKNPLKC